MKPLQISDLMAPKTTARLRNVAPKANAVTLSAGGGVEKKLTFVWDTAQALWSVYTMGIGEERSP